MHCLRTGECTSLNLTLINQEHGRRKNIKESQAENKYEDGRYKYLDNYTKCKQTKILKKRLADHIQTHILQKRHMLQHKDTEKFQVWKNKYCTNTSPPKAGIALLLSGGTVFRQDLSKEKHIIIKRSFHQEPKIIHVHNNTTSKHNEQKLTEPKALQTNFNRGGYLGHSSAET